MQLTLNIGNYHFKFQVFEVKENVDVLKMACQIHSDILESFTYMIKNEKDIHVFNIKE